jgi:hypothetical protein
MASPGFAVTRVPFTMRLTLVDGKKRGLELGFAEGGGEVLYAVASESAMTFS